MLLLRVIGFRHIYLLILMKYRTIKAFLVLSESRFLMLLILFPDLENTFPFAVEVSFTSISSTRYIVFRFGKLLFFFCNRFWEHYRSWQVAAQNLSDLSKLCACFWFENVNMQLTLQLDASIWFHQIPQCALTCIQKDLKILISILTEKPGSFYVWN